MSDIQRKSLPGPVASAEAEPTAANGRVGARRASKANAGDGSASESLMLLKALRRRWPLAIAAGVLGAGVIGSATWFLLPSAKYSAQSTLLVATHRPKVIFETAERQTDYRTYQKTQESLVRSRMVLKAAIQRPEIPQLAAVRKGDDPVGMLERDLKIEFSGGSEMLRISLSGDHPEEVAALVNAVTKSYLECVDNFDRKNRVDRFEKLQKLYRDYQNDMEQKRKFIRGLAEQVGSDDRKLLAHEHELEQERLSLVRQEATQLRSQIRRAQAEVEILESEVQDAAYQPISPTELAHLIDVHPAVRAAAEAIDNLKGRISQAERLVRQKGTDVTTTRLHADLKAAQQRYGENAHRVEPIIAARLREQIIEQSRRKLTEARQRLTILQHQASEVDKEAEGIVITTRDLSRGAMDLQTHQDDLRLKEEAAKKVGVEVSALDVEVQAAPRIVPLDWAEPPKTKDQSKAVKITGTSATMAFLAAVIGVAFWEYRLQRVTTIDEVVREIGLRMVGTLPIKPRRASRPTQAASQPPDRRWRSSMLESIDATRTVLLHAARVEGIRAVMVTSAVGDEGKTTLSTCLAASLARAGRRTVLIDCDLRRPSVQALFEVPLKPGLCEVLRGEAELAEVIIPGNPVGIWIIPAGQCDASALQSLACDRLHAVCEELKQTFDFIVADSAPVLPVADSLVVGQQIDGVIFSIRESVSRIPQVLEAYRRMEILGVRLLGAVVHGGTQAQYGYDHRYADQPAN